MGSRPDCAVCGHNLMVHADCFDEALVNGACVPLPEGSCMDPGCSCALFRLKPGEWEQNPVIAMMNARALT